MNDDKLKKKIINSIYGSYVSSKLKRIDGELIKLALEEGLSIKDLYEIFDVDDVDDYFLKKKINLI